MLALIESVSRKSDTSFSGFGRSQIPLEDIWEKIKMMRGQDMPWCRTGVSKIFIYIKDQIIKYFQFWGGMSSLSQLLSYATVS